MVKKKCFFRHVRFSSFRILLLERVRNVRFLQHSKFSIFSILFWNDINPLYTDVFFRLIHETINLAWLIVYIEGSRVIISNKNLISFSEVRSSLRNLCRPWWNATLWGISSGSSLFAKVPTYTKGYTYRNWRAVSSSLINVTALCPCARHIYPSLVLVQPRRTHLYITERLLMGSKENQTNKIP